MREILVTFALLLSAVAAYPQVPLACRASPEHAGQLRRQAGEARQHLRVSELVALPEVTARANVILVPNDDTISPFNRSFNLKGKSVTFTRNGPDDFSSRTGPLVFDDDRGEQLALDPATLSASYTIGGFDFPFFGTTRRTLHVSRLLAIYFAPPPAPATFRQYHDADLLLQNTPVIAPLLTTTPGQTNFRPPAVFVRETADRVVVTWYEATRPVEIQAVLFSSGDIRLSYRSIGNTRGGALYITSGTEAWRSPTLIGSATDGTNDFTTSNPPEIAAMLDITRAETRRIGDTDVLQFITKVRSPIDRAVLGSDRSIGLNITLGSGAFVSATISGAGVSGDQLSVPFFAVQGATPLMRVEGDTITITVAQPYLLGHAVSDDEVMFALANQFGGDTVSVKGKIDAAPRPMRTDFAVQTSVASFPGPISDAFVIPHSNVFSAWQRAAERLDLDPEAIDGFVVYQNFRTLGTAVSSVGNAGVDNIAISSDLISSANPREPNLIDMHTIREFWNQDDDVSVLMHEWGHRWMFFIEHNENGAPTHVLNDGGHPALYVDTRAAFQVANGFDCSVMGGYTFTDNGDGSFTGPPDTCMAGYSWLDLYLMGLAAPGEVPDFFYLADTDPSIEELPYVETQTIRATRKNVSIGDVTARMGLRHPAYPETQREFKVLFVLVYDATQPLPAEDIAVVARYADLFRERFAIATGRRASVDTSFPTPPRRRGARR